MTENLTAIATCLFIAITGRVLSNQISLRLLAAASLCSIAFIYVGFSLLSNDPVSILFEVTVALLFFFTAILGYANNSYLIAAGIVLHGIWDLVHHLILIVKTVVADYWPLYCGLVDIIIGVYFYISFRREATRTQAEQFSSSH